MDAMSPSESFDIPHEIFALGQSSALKGLGTGITFSRLDDGCFNRPISIFYS